MARKKASEGGNRSQFIRDQVTANKKVKWSEVAEAWKAAGNKDPIQQSLFYLVKSKMGKGTGKRGRRAKAEVMATGDANAAILAIEQELDKLVAKAMAMSDSKLAADLRMARRRVSAKLVG